MLEIYREAARLIEDGRRGALATIISTQGSTPGEETSKMLVRDDGSTLGTIGGGCSEADVWRLAMEVIATDRPVRTSFRLTAATAAETGLLCGGEFEVYIEPLGNPTVTIFGAGHIARSLTTLLGTLDYHTVVIDDRESFASRERFPEAAEVLVRDFEHALEGLTLGPSSILIVVTRGHQHDETVLAQAVMSDAGYVGLIGSRGKIAAIRKNLHKRGIPIERLERVRSPIGLEIGSRTPAEIAVSIAAELIAYRRGKLPPPQSPRDAGPAGKPRRQAPPPPEDARGAHRST
ncbi:MAG: XdhC family protein [Planctomycetota bacterium]